MLGRPWQFHNKHVRLCDPLTPYLFGVVCNIPSINSAWAFQYAFLPAFLASTYAGPASRFICSCCVVRSSSIPVDEKAESFRDFLLRKTHCLLEKEAIVTIIGLGLLVRAVGKCKRAS